MVKARSAQWQALRDGDEWDVLVIGGGATGLGIALDAQLRGLRTALVEAGDFAGGTSSRSTKLIHGGVRYLQQGNVALVREALAERGNLLQNAADVVRPLSFIIPCQYWWEKWYYGVGLKVYDALAGKGAMAASYGVDGDYLREQAPEMQEDFAGGVVYEDAQFDDARLAWLLARQAMAEGAVLCSYARVEALLEEEGTVVGARVRGAWADEEIAVRAKVVINAAGVWAESILNLDTNNLSNAGPKIQVSQGIHLVFARERFPLEEAVLVPKTSDGRVLFMIPWLDHVVVGTTDTPLDAVVREPRALPEEVDFVLQGLQDYWREPPTRADVKSCYAGLRPLVKTDDRSSQALSREHWVHFTGSGLCSVLGGKWTTYRRMAEDALDQLQQKGWLGGNACATAEYRLEEAPLMKGPVVLADRADAALPYSREQLSYCLREEMVMGWQDLLARRTRCLLLDAEATWRVAQQMQAEVAEVLGWTSEQAEQALLGFKELCELYALRRLG